MCSREVVLILFVVVSNLVPFVSVTRADFRAKGQFRVASLASL